MQLSSPGWPGGVSGSLQSGLWIPVCPDPATPWEVRLLRLRIDFAEQQGPARAASPAGPYTPPSTYLQQRLAAAREEVRAWTGTLACGHVDPSVVPSKWLEVHQ